MTEIAAVPWNGLKVVSTFSGCGGSCLGFRMAGYRVVWANEFIPAAAETYRANHPNTLLSTEDIRKVRPGAILEATGFKVGELDAMEGSPPCASFSTAGKREKHWGKAKKYSDTVQRVDDLFFEYVRLIEGLKPKVFVAENVSGLVKGVTGRARFFQRVGELMAAK
jgi:DNA (cytosine-5)-methyltransferase 1